MAAKNWKIILATLALMATVLAASEYPTTTANTPPGTGPDFGTQRIGTITIPDDRNEKWARLPEATGGVGEITYEIVSRTHRPGNPPEEFVLPAGLNLTTHDGHRYIEGQTHAPPGFYNLKYLATDEDGNTDSINFTILVRTVPRFEHDAYTATLYINAFTASHHARSHPTPTVGGFPTISILSYQMTGLQTLARIVNDLEFNPTTRVLSGTPHTVGSEQLTLTATHAYPDSISTVITVNVENKLAPPTGLDVRPLEVDTFFEGGRRALLTWQHSPNHDINTVYDVYIQNPHGTLTENPMGTVNDPAEGFVVCLDGLKKRIPQYFFDFCTPRTHGDQPDNLGLREYPYLTAWIVARDKRGEAANAKTASDSSEKVIITTSQITSVNGDSREADNGRLKVAWQEQTGATSYTIRWRALGPDALEFNINHPDWRLDQASLPGSFQGITTVPAGTTSLTIEPLNLETIYAVQLNYTRTKESGEQTERVFAANDHYGYPATEPAGGGQRIASIPLRQTLDDGHYEYTLCTETFKEPQELWARLMRHAMREWTEATANLISASESDDRRPCTDYSDYANEAADLVEAHFRDRILGNDHPTGEEIRKHAEKVLRRQQFEGLQTVRDADLLRNEISMQSINDFDRGSEEASYRFKEVAKIAGTPFCKKACAYPTTKGGNNPDHSTVDIVFEASQLDPLTAENFPGGNTTGTDTERQDGWDPSDIRYNSCEGVLEQYADVIHEIGHALGLIQGTDNISNQEHGHPNQYLFESAVSYGTMDGCSPHPLDVMGIYAIYQATKNGN